MSTMQRTATKTASCSRPSAIRPFSSRRASSVRVSASQDAPVVSRREAITGTLGLSAAVVASGSIFFPAPAQAFLGLGDDGESVKAQYTKETGDILGKVNTVLALDRNDPSKDELIKDVRKDINSWVAKYRREPLVSGRPSYGNVYSAVNALAGHYNNFGTSAPVPKKRLERLVKELNDASLFLSKGR